MIGSYVLSSGFFDAYYQQGKRRTLLMGEFSGLFNEYDFLLSPTAPTVAFGIGENTSDPVKMYLSDVMTVPPSLAGLPAISKAGRRKCRRLADRCAVNWSYEVGCRIDRTERQHGGAPWIVLQFLFFSPESCSCRLLV